MTMMTSDRELLEARIAAIEMLRDRDQRALRELNEAHRQAHEREHHAVEVAMSKAEQAMTIRLGQMNEFRTQIDQERTTYVRTDRLDDRLLALADRISALERVQENMSGRFAAASLALVVLMFAVGVGLRFL